MIATHGLAVLVVLSWPRMITMVVSEALTNRFEWSLAGLSFAVEVR